MLLTTLVDAVEHAVQCPQRSDVRRMRSQPISSAAGFGVLPAERHRIGRAHDVTAAARRRLAATAARTRGSSFVRVKRADASAPDQVAEPLGVAHGRSGWR